jgi:cell division protein FtsI (penicillin-binding protein 3)
MPEKNERGQYTNWYKTSLAWMSIGYETQVPPIATVTFYNAIANNGCMMQPRLVKALQKDGKIVHEFKPVVLKEQIAKPQTIATMQTILTHVVSQGLGRKASPGTFPVAGKTGTAQVSGGKAGYHSGVMQYWLSFCGFFPANKPRYTCIVCLKKTGLPASGGGMSGVVFREIAENVMAQDLVLRTEDARSAHSNLIPDVKNGDIQAAEFVLNELSVARQSNGATLVSDGTPVWGQASHDYQKVTLSKKDTQEYVMPDITGMGARDAVFLLEKRGVRVRLRGTGSVKSQSIPFGTSLHDGMLCDIELG